jgi:hypothetical protein
MKKTVDHQNVAASVRQRLLNMARTKNKSFNDVLTSFGLERILYRLGQSDHANHFVLKGALLFFVWQGESYRVTRDVDLLGFGDSGSESLAKVFREICATPSDPPDGIEFNLDAVVVQPIRREQEYGGMRANLQGTLAKAQIPIQVDIGFGDIITPGPETIDFPTLLDNPAPRLRAYPPYSVVAEKFHTMVHLGVANSRMKDFYDVWLISRIFDLDGEILANAVRNTFQRRDTPIPGVTPLALTEEFSDDSRKQIQWNAFLRNSKPDRAEADLGKLIADLAEFFVPILKAVRAKNA